jgi:hypothetical protein
MAVCKAVHSWQHVLPAAWANTGCFVLGIR